jgi:hypothetical protein
VAEYSRPAAENRIISRKGAKAQRSENKGVKTMKKFFMPVVLTATLFISVAEYLPDSPLRFGLVRDAQAIIGMPWTPFSFAGAARRSMYREAAWNAAAYNVAATNAAAANMAAANAYAAQTAAANANAAAAQAAAANAAAAAANAQRAAASLPIGSTVPYLPPNCTSTVVNDHNYFNCGGVFYRAGFQGNQVVYIVSQP